jgi:5-methylcytosine-specific restriction endonuclease McrA
MARMRQDPEYRKRTNAIVRERYPERYAPKYREYRQSLKKDFFAHRARTHRYRFKTNVTKDDFLGLWVAQEGKCAITGWDLDDAAQIDHILPIARGGGHGMDNLRWVCAAANRAKRELTDDEFIELARAVVSQLGSSSKETTA